MKHIAALFAIFANACASAPPVASMADNHWQFVAFHSMDDAQGSQPFIPAGRFSLQLSADGKARLMLDCNRAMGQWHMTSAGADGGSFSFGPLAGTRARCAAPHHDERLLQQLEYVRSYRIKDGRLYLSLMADGGIIELQQETE